MVNDFEIDAEIATLISYFHSYIDADRCLCISRAGVVWMQAACHATSVCGRLMHFGRVYGSSVESTIYPLLQISANVSYAYLCFIALTQNETECTNAVDEYIRFSCI